MIIFRQKNYSWDEIKRATKTIGTGALIGGLGGFALGRPEKNYNNPKRVLISAGIGATVGALAGTGFYRVGLKERQKAKQQAEQFKEKYGKEPAEYFVNNLPKGYIDTVARICKEISDLNDFVFRSHHKGLDWFYISNSCIYIDPINYSEEIIDYISSHKLDSNIIPIIHCVCSCFEDIIGSDTVTYNIKTKKYNVFNVQLKTLKETLLYLLDFVYSYLEDDVENNYEEDDEDGKGVSEEFKVWETEYYNKAVNIIKKLKI